MLQAFAVSPAAAEAAFSPPAAPATLAPRLVREKAADLVAHHQLDKAWALVSRSLQDHPESQDLLVMMALICEVRHDWDAAAQHLEQLIRVQGQGVSAESLSHYVRVLRCDGRLERALQMAQRGLLLYPGHEMLTSEAQTLASVLGQAAGDQEA